MIRKGHYHFTGVAGVGMSAIAQIVLEQSSHVTGSDRDYDAGKKLPVIEKLRNAGIVFVPQDGSGVKDDCLGVVVSTAIEGDNPDVIAAKHMKVPLIHRADMLAKMVEGLCCIAVTGTSGKSTVTGMIGWLLEDMGADPTVVNGAPLLNWSDAQRVGNMRYGKSNIWVIEADESDKTLLKFSPDWAVITNVSQDHFGLDESVELFRQFSGRVRKGVISVLKKPELFSLFDPQVSSQGSSFVYNGTEFVVPLPGRHNAENAFYAVLMCEELGFPLYRIRKSMLSFKGIQRRLETVGEARGVIVIDDYGHNPAKIRAAWLAVSQQNRRVIGIWRPHGFRPLATMMEDLVATFKEVCGSNDILYVLPVYDAGGTADRSITSETLVRLLCGSNVTAKSVASNDQLVQDIGQTATSGDVVLTMGARDPNLPELARALLNVIRARFQDADSL